MTLHTPFIAALERTPFLTMVAIGSSEILEVSRSRTRSLPELEERLLDFTRDHGCRTLVIEPGSRLAVIAAVHRLRVVRMRLALAKETLLGGDDPSHAQLYQHLLVRYPSLSRFSTATPIRPDQDPWSRWRNEKLLAIALGLAARFTASETVSASDAEHRPSDPAPALNIVPSFH